MWGSRAEKGNNYEDAVKEQVIEDLETMLLSEEHMKEYKVTLSQAEKDVIEKSAREFVKIMRFIIRIRCPVKERQ